ncbi:MAG TPA: hypothetical protein DCG19_02305 [Cryomorphaceae bacterium]|nr:hypothetical protein [Owenweeksia sp.]MBF99652.1 hypothetical protein [Owenweeksia sp.]HAD96205.1 hypothetical protein [Cryomorphaceae bacterium]HBF18711.1 hypothetical protein [Cryomorphaceae bacterium]|tara:strand:+ start:91 stop:276 length:186 start_codon:yes stop_codon:yes gene_type:complete
METLGWTLLILGLITVALWIYAIADILKGSLDGQGSKILWLVIVLFFPIVGVVLYFLVGRR